MSKIIELSDDEKTSIYDDVEVIENPSVPTINLDFCGFDSVDQFSKAGLQCIVDATKAANALPSGASRDLYSAYPAFQKILNIQSERILNIIQNVIKYQNIKGNIQKRDDDEKYELLQECNDIMLERVNSNLDVIAGIRKEPETILVESTLQSTNFKPVSSSWNNMTNKNAKTARIPRLLTAKNIMRPQISFKTPVDNSNNTPFEPRLKYKPNSIKPLAILPEYGDNGEIESYLHPYEFELNKFEVPKSQLCEVVPIPAMDIESTPLDFINNEEQLKTLMNELKDVKEIGVDLEHHNYRTFQGITCLMQLSTRKKDYIIDTITLRDELHILNEIFTKPDVVKVFHGADFDVEWLQRDLSLYVVNMFDTHQAAKRIGVARLSLSFLLKHYCDIDADKTYQLADWRIRPLPLELITYARGDTHHLLYIYDLMKNELLKLGNGQTNLLESVYNSSTDLCKKRYIKPRITSESFMELYRKSKKNFDNRQLYALRHIFQWRDKIARIEDESYGYVLPNHMMLQIAESLPREIQGILACCNPIPPLIRQHLIPIHQIILKAREQSVVKPIIEQQININSTTQIRDINNSLYCPHDLSYSTDFRDDLPTLLNSNGKDTIQNGKLQLAEPVLSVFNCKDDPDLNDKMAKLKKVKFVSPYSRYKCILPFAEEERLAELRSAEELRQQKKLEEPVISVPVIQKTPVVEQEVEPSLNQLKQKRKSDQSAQEVVESKKPKINATSEKESSGSESESDSDDSDVVEVPLPKPAPIVIEDEAVKNEQQPNNKKNKKNKNKNSKDRYITKNTTKQGSNQAVSFDYSKVDYKRFQGGSQVNTPNSGQIKSKFNAKSGKGKKDMKKFNKMFLFGSLNKKGGK